MRRGAIIAAMLVGIGPVAWADPPGGNAESSRGGARRLKLPSQEESFHFLIFGDRTGGPAEGIRVLERAVVDANLLGPDLVMTVGDMVQGYNARTAWLEQMREFRRVMDRLRAPWFPVAGNHDVTWAGSEPPPGHHESDYEEHFGPLWYWFAHKGCAFVALYSDEGDSARNRKGWDGPHVNRMSAQQLAWLERTLNANREREHVFVFLHHPRWLREHYPGSNWDDVHQRLVAAGNVTAVFAGHLHRQRYDGVRDGIAYHTLGTTGGSAPMNAPGTGWLHHMDLVTVRKSGITVATIPVGTVIDPRDMTPERLADIDRLRASMPRHGTIALYPDGKGRGTYEVEVANPTERPAVANVEILGGDATWWFAPNHAHVRLAPGATERLRFRWQRDRADWDGMRVPEVSVRWEYETESSRSEFPGWREPAALTVQGLNPAWFDGAYDRAMRLKDGAHAELRDAHFVLPDGPFTVEAWVRPEATNGRRTLVSKAETSEFGLFLLEGKPAFYAFVGAGYVAADAPAALPCGSWHHVAGVYDGHEVRCYVDGALVARASGCGRRRRNPWSLFVGADPDASGRPHDAFDGTMDEVRISSVARYGGEPFRPTRRAIPDCDTVLLLHLDAGLGPVVPDHGPCGCHAVAHGGATYVDTR